MKIKRIALNLISCFALLVSSIPSTAVFVSAVEYTPATTPTFEQVGTDEQIPCVFANGTPITVKTEDGKVVVEYGEGQKLDNGGQGLPENVRIFGGSHNKEGILQSSDITIDGVKLAKAIVFGGGLHKSQVENANITVKGETTISQIDGGGSNALVHDDCASGKTGDSWQSGANAETESKTIVDNAVININGDEGDNVSVTFAIYGGGHGISCTKSTKININGGDIEFVGAGGSNGYTGSATVNIKGGSIGKVQSVNRGSMGSAEITVSGGTVENLYVGGEKDADDVTGTITSSSVNVTADGKVDNLDPGTSGGAPIENKGSDNFQVEIAENADVTLSSDFASADIDLACQHKFPLEKVAEAKEPTCEETGKIDGWKCNICGALFTDANGKTPLQDRTDDEDEIVNEDDFTIKANGHSLVEKKAKKCDGKSEYTYYVCEVCGKYFEDNKETEIEDIEAKVKELGNHKDLEKTSEEKEATCMETGITPGYKCKECGQTVIEPQVLNRNDNHDWPETWKGTLDDDDVAKGYTAVTNCKEGGWQVEECARGCGAKHYKYVEPKEHELGEAVIKEGDETDKEATCTEPGQKTKTCKNCPYEEKVTIPALNHTDGNGRSTIVAVPKVEASCKGEGTEGHDRYWYCTQCKREEGTYESKHDNDEYKWFSDAACTQEIEDHDSIFKTEEHDFSITIPGKAPTCQASGQYSYKQCSKCGDIEDGKSVSDFYASANEFGHVYSSGLQGEATESTCLAKGKYQYFKCELCEKTYIVKSDAKDEWENYTDIEEIHPVGDTPSDDELALKPLAEHKWGTPVEYKAPECEAKGNYGSVQCTVCNDKFKTTDKDGVAIENEDEYVKITEDTELEIAALGHAWSSADATHHFADNCTTYEYYKCTRDCGKIAMVVTESEDTTILDSVKVKYITSEDEAKKPEASHSWVDKVTEVKEPNCTEDGTYAYAQCDKCGVFAEKLPDGSYQEWTVADDKNGDGVVTVDDFVKKATGHDFESGFVKGYKSPDPCTQPGLNSYAVCQNDGCGVYALATLKAEASDGSDNPADYDYTPWTVEDNDKNSDGEITEDDFVIDVVGHIYGELHPAYTPEGAAACTENGKKAYYECSACKKLFIDEGGDKKEVTENELIVSAPGHQEEAIPASEDVAATCTGEGLEGGTRCSVCKTILTPRKVIPALGHDFKEESYKTKTPATCETKEIQEAKCSRCDVTQTREKPNSEPLGHEYQKVEAKEATCTEPGNIEYYKCSRCPKLFVDEEGAKKEITADKVVTTKDHEYGELIDEVAATCTNEGTKAHYKCSVCEKLFVDEEGGTKKEVVAAELVIEKIAHTPKTVDAVAATCTKTGLTEGSVCDVCGEVLVVQTATPMIDHTPVTDAAVEANCTMSGLTEGKHCSVCGGTLVAQVVTPALGHNYVNGVCTRDGAIEPNYGDNTSVDNGNSKPSNNSNNTVNNSNNNNITTAPATKIPAKALKVKQAKVKKLKVKSKAKKTINVNWKKVSGAKGYEVEVSKNSNFKKNARVVLKKTSKLKLTIKNKKIKSKKTYYVRVRAYTTYKSNGATVKAYSSWNYVLRKVKVK